MDKCERPWGWYEVLLDSETCKTKRISVKPGHQPSYQYHQYRSETWIVVTGEGVAVIDDGKGPPQARTIGAGSIISVPRKSKHTIKNTHDEECLVFIEVQLGTYFGEDDIVRLSDNYGRDNRD